MIDVVGLGPGGLDRTDPATLALLLDPGRRVILRTLRHPAAEQLASRREVESCDDLYASRDTFGAVYEAIADRVVTASLDGAVVYAVPGSPLVGEFAVAEIRRRAEGVVVHPAESFVDAALTRLGIDPLRDGFQLLDGHDLPDPLVIDKPTLVGHLDTPEALADALARIDRVLPDGVEVTLLAGLGANDERVVTARPTEVDAGLAGLRTSLFVPPEPGGLVGAIRAMRRLRDECPWDRDQTHHSLVRYLVEEAYELADALAALPDDPPHDWVAYGEVEDELGDLLLQVLFHATIARQAGAFDVDDVAERLRQKLVRRHPHVFADVEVADAAEVKANWDQIKEAERGEAVASVLEGVPTGVPGLTRAAEVQRRAARVGFDWPDAAPVLDKVREECEELAQVLEDRAARGRELGDLLFAVVNLARHLDVEPEVAIRQAVHRFEDRFRSMEEMGSLEGLTLEALDARWEEAKRRGR